MRVETPDQSKSRSIINRPGMLLLFCLSLGLAPFTPEPHIWGKLRWIWGGAVGMKSIDWFDTLLHGWPWLLLLRWLVMKAVRKLT